MMRRWFKLSLGIILQVVKLNYDLTNQTIYKVINFFSNIYIKIPITHILLDLIIKKDRMMRNY